MAIQKQNYDPNKLQVFHETEIPVNDFTSLVGRVYSYDGGERRMKVLSRIVKKDGTKATLKQFPPLTEVKQITALTELLTKCSKFLTSQTK